MTRRSPALAGLVLVAAALIAACGGAGGSPSPEASAEPNSPTIASKDVKFDRTELDVPAGRPFTLVYENEESTQHNVAIYSDGSAGSVLFKGAIYGGPATHVYSVPALAAGTYYFRCDIHPDMNGSVVAKP
jgi:plastocyanin